MIIIRNGSWVASWHRHPARPRWTYSTLTSSVVIIRFGRPIISILVRIVNIRQFIQYNIICFQVLPSGVGCVWVECHRLMVLEFLVRFDRQDLELNNLCGSSNLHIRLSTQHSRKIHPVDPSNLYHRFLSLLTSAFSSSSPTWFWHSLPRSDSWYCVLIYGLAIAIAQRLQRWTLSGKSTLLPANTIASRWKSSSS